MQIFRTTHLELVPLEPKAITQLIHGDRAGAENTIGGRLPNEFPTVGDLTGLLPIQLHRMQESPDRRDWMARLMIANDGAILYDPGRLS